ncbi:hypothetical protein ABPG74_000740 [Tetrahymena malaccensis]
MSKSDLIYPNNFNADLNNIFLNIAATAQMNLPELGSLKRNKSDRVYLPSEPSKKVKSYFNACNYSLENIENQNNSLNNSSLDQSADSSSESCESDSSCKANQSQHDSTSSINNQFEENVACNQINILQEEEFQQNTPIKLKSDILFSVDGHCINYEDRNNSNVFSEENQNVSMIIGYLCLTFAAVFFTSTLFSIFFAPFLQPTTHNLIDFLTNDKYYCFLIPLSLPVTCLIIYMNWVSMKYFKHS